MELGKIYDRVEYLYEYNNERPTVLSARFSYNPRLTQKPYEEDKESANNMLNSREISPFRYSVYPKQENSELMDKRAMLRYLF